MRLQKNTSLALYSVLESAADPTRHVAAAEIAGKYGVSPHHLAKVLSELARAGILASVRGVGGGYRFIGNARRLTLMDVIQHFEDLGPERNGDGGGRTPVGEALRRVQSEIDELAKSTFSTITIATMLRLVARQRGARSREGDGARAEAPIAGGDGSNRRQGAARP
jgi:Rrf2 family protein